MLQFRLESGGRFGVQKMDAKMAAAKSKMKRILPKLRNGPRFGVQKMDAKMAAVFGTIFRLVKHWLFGNGATMRWVKQAENLWSSMWMSPALAFTGAVCLAQLWDQVRLQTKSNLQLQRQGQRTSVLRRTTTKFSSSCPRSFLETPVASQLHLCSGLQNFFHI